MNYTGVICFIALGVGMPVSSSLASTPLEERFLACALEYDSAARLACYDRAASAERPAARSAAPLVETPRVAEGARGAMPDPVVEGAGGATPDPEVVERGAASVPQAAASAADPAGEPASAQAQFGLSGSELARRREMADRESDRVSGRQADPDRLNATVVALSARPRGERVVTLDNGQVWVQKAPQYIPIEAGDSVTILKGALRSYRLVAGGRSTAVTRVE
jgi:hypothetical protein